MQAPERPSRLALGPLHQPKHFCALLGGWRVPEQSARTSPGQVSAAAFAATGGWVQVHGEDFFLPQFCQEQGTSTPFSQSGGSALPQKGLLGLGLWMGLGAVFCCTPEQP